MLKAAPKINQVVLTPEISQMLGLPALRNADDKYLYKSLVIVTSRPEPGMIGKAPNVPDMAFCWAGSVREAVYKIELAYGKNPHGPKLVEIINSHPTDIVQSQLMDKDLSAEELGLLGAGREN